MIARIYLALLILTIIVMWIADASSNDWFAAGLIFAHALIVGLAIRRVT